MTQFPDVRRHPDGSIDLDFYRRAQVESGSVRDSLFSRAACAR
jgi:hypothetical protein